MKQIRRRLTEEESDIITAYREGVLDANDDIIKENVKLAKIKQRYQDVNRIERKSFREYVRLENSVESLNKELIKILKKEGLKIKTTKFRKNKKDSVILLQLSDLHLNELVDIPSNKYDFYVASSRLQKLASEIISVGKWQGSSELVITVLGDLINSDRRLDELMGASTNRAKASQLAVRLLSMFLLDLNKHFNVHLSGITGNESRAKQELGWIDVVATDNYDFTIYDQLKILFENKPGFEFEMMEANQKVIQVKGKNILLIHGHQIGGARKDSQKAVQDIIGKFSQYGISVDYVVSGHIHCAHISDYFSRNASLVGSNAYSEEALGYVSRASQNLHVITRNSINSTKIDLQDYSGYEGYPLEKDIDAYNAKSVSKAKGNEVIVKVVV